MKVVTREDLPCFQSGLLRKVDSFLQASTICVDSKTKIAPDAFLLRNTAGGVNF